MQMRGNWKFWPVLIKTQLLSHSTLTFIVWCSFSQTQNCSVNELSKLCLRNLQVKVVFNLSSRPDRCKHLNILFVEVERKSIDCTKNKILKNVKCLIKFKARKIVKRVENFHWKSFDWKSFFAFKSGRNAISPTFGLKVSAIDEKLK